MQACRPDLNHASSLEFGAASLYIPEMIPSQEGFKQEINTSKGTTHNRQKVQEAEPEKSHATAPGPRGARRRAGGVGAGSGRAAWTPRAGSGPVEAAPGSKYFFWSCMAFERLMLARFVLRPDVDSSHSRPGGPHGGLRKYLQSQVAQNNRPVHPKIAQNCLKLPKIRGRWLSR